MVEPNEYWNASDESRAQRLYAGFCEFASSVLDYCEGRRLLVEGRNSTGRLNWSATALYYSLVHSGRFLVFVGAGDFPTSHSRLAKCFSQTGAMIRTDWLGRLLTVGYRHTPRAADVYSMDLGFQRVHDFWLPFSAPGEAMEVLTWFGGMLDRARDLRNENNYEALLIAHEYEHPHMTEVFRNLAATLEVGARRSIEILARWYSGYLANTNANVPIRPVASAAKFIGHYVAKRIEQPAGHWYPREIAEEVTELVTPLRDLGAPVVNPEVHQIERLVDWTIFNPKRSLMTAFRDKTESLNEYIQRGNGRATAGIVQSGALRPVRKERSKEQHASADLQVTKETKGDLAKQHQLRGKARSEQRLRLIAKLDGLPAMERLKAIARDQEHPIEYYPVDYSRIEQEQLVLMDSDTRNALLRRIESRIRVEGPWKQLAVRIRAATNTIEGHGSHGEL